MAGAVALCPVVVGNVQQIGDVYQVEVHVKALALRKKTVTDNTAQVKAFVCLHFVNILVWQLTVCGPSGEAGTAAPPLVVLLLKE